MWALSGSHMGIYPVWSYMFPRSHAGDWMYELQNSKISALRRKNDAYFSVIFYKECLFDWILLVLLSCAGFVWSVVDFQDYACFSFNFLIIFTLDCWRLSAKLTWLPCIYGYHVVLGGALGSSFSCLSWQVNYSWN